MKKFIVISGVIVLLGLVAGGIYYLLNRLPEENPSETQTPETKTYRNEEFGFEFQYPSDWKIIENPYGSPFSKFNLIVVPAEEKYLPDPILVNIVMPDFAYNAFSDLRGIDVVVANVIGKKYEYQEEGLSEISIILPFGENEIILGTNKTYEDVFNRVISTFKFLK